MLIFSLSMPYYGVTTNSFRVVGGWWVDGLMEEDVRADMIQSELLLTYLVVVLLLLKSLGIVVKSLPFGRQ